MLERTVAHTNRAVSTPSRPTATTAIQTMPQPELPAERDLDSDPSSSPLSSRAFFPHPEDHPGHQADGDEGQEASKDLLGLEGEGLGPPGHDGAGDQWDQCCQPDPQPQLGQGVPAGRT